MAGNPPSNFESLSRKLHEPLIPPLVAVISGILFVRVLGFDPTLALLCTTLSALLWFLAGNTILFWLAIASASRTDNKPKPTIDTDPREVVSLERCVDSLPQREAERLFFTFTAAPGARLRVSLYLKPEEKAADWAYGHRLQLPLRIRPVHNAGNPGNFDEERYFANREIYWSASISKGYPIIEVPIC